MFKSLIKKIFNIKDEIKYIISRSVFPIKDYGNINEKLDKMLKLKNRK